ncbi:MAG: hybrid sensor histidine kinase/response regulator [Deltaproteobacteria bacterium]|nr:hybrid sensor histidine kinase/response regulator [Deltaproteobacteria bacterium]
MVPIGHDDALYGYLVKEIAAVQVPHTREHFTWLWRIGLLLIAAFLANLAALLFYYRKYICHDVHGLLRHFQQCASDSPSPKDRVTENRVAEFSIIQETFDDILLRLRAAEAEKRQLAEKLECTRLATQVAHDLRSPLSSIQVAGRILGEEVGREGRCGQAVNLLQLGCQRLWEIANDLLHTRASAPVGEQALAVAPVHSPFAVHKMCDELVGEFQAQALGNGVTFVKAYYTEALVWRGDRSGWTRALGNLMKNALEAMQNGAAHRDKQLTIGTAVEQDRVLVRVADTGPGMTEATMAKILQGGHTEGKADGHGIGMTVVREMVTAHGGTLAVASVVGQGTTFTLTVPATLLESTVVTIPVEEGSLVLVLDDDPGMREQWRMLLWERDVMCERFTCWEEYADSPAAKDTTHPPSTVIVDYHFDNSAVDGVTIVRRLRAHGVPYLVLCTAEYWKPSLHEAVRDLGVTLCPKPVPRVVVEWMTTTPISTNVVADCPAETIASTDSAAHLDAAAQRSQVRGA